MRIGIEAEYWTIDDRGELVPSDDLATGCNGVEQEFVDPLVEVKTPPCDSLETVRSAFVTRLARLLERANDRGKRLVPLGTPLGDEAVSLRSGERIDVQQAVLGADFRHATHCAGTHIHLEQTNVLHQLRALTALDPAFVLVNTTPYYRERRVATCARPAAYRKRCYETLPTHGQLWEYPDSVAKWRTRRDERFETFVRHACDAGIDRQTVESAFTPADAVWSPVRLRDDLGTVEWRGPDTAPPTEVLQLVDDVTRFVERAVDRGTQIATDDTTPGMPTPDEAESADTKRAPGGTDPITLPPFDTLCDTVDTAIERGRAAPEIDRYLRGLGFDPDAYRPVGARIDGDERLDSATVRTLRLRYAERLERDVRELADEMEVPGVDGEPRAIAP